jgi:hypothetical protein
MSSAFHFSLWFLYHVAPPTVEHMSPALNWDRPWAPLDGTMEEDGGQVWAGAPEDSAEFSEPNLVTT